MSFLPVIGSTRASTVDEAEVVAAPQQSADVTPSPPSSGRATRRPQNYSITDSQSSTEAQAARIAKRIWGGSIEHDGYMKMIGRVRQQFLSPQMDHPPMVLNPTVPSSMRPEEAGVPKFSRGLKLYRHLCTNLQQRQQADQTSPASEEAPIPPAVEEPEVELADLPTLEEKTLRLLQLESLSREHIAATEKWDRQVVSEMMIVRYVTCVLKPEVEKHLAMERHVRGELQAEEADERYDLTHQSEVAQLIHNGLESAQAELIKASRLQRNDRRYPRTSLPSIAASTASSKAALVPSTSPPPTEDARSILQRYVREKHGSGTAWGAPPPPRDDGLPPIHRSPTPRILSLSTYMQLMEDYQTERAMVVTLEEEGRRACLRLVDEDRQRLARWVDKNRHLERLVQWRAAREQRLKEEMDDLTKPSRMEYRLEEGTARQLTQEEEPARLALHEEEAEAHDQLCTHAGHLQEEHQTEILELRCRQACDATFAETQAQLIGLAVQQEEDGRKLVEDARQKWSNITGQRAHELIQQLAKVCTSSTKSAAVAVLQRAFRQSILGKLGWRYSHWLVGREVQARRNARTIERGQAEMASWKAQIASESQHITNQILSEQRAAQQLIVSAEEKKREEMVTDEARGWLDLRRLWNQDLRVQVFLPLSSKCVADEHVQRTEADVMEGIERRRLISWFRRMMSIISSKLLTTQNEQSYRDDIEQEEYYAHKELVGEELDRREELRLDAEEAARQLVRDQAQWVWSAVEEVEAFADELLRGHLQVILRLQMRLLDRSLAHTDVFARVAAAEREERADLLSSWALEDSALLAVVSLHSHALSLANEGMELTQQYEELRRAKAVEDEDEQWKGIEERMRGKSGPRLLTRTDQCRAVDAISRFYKRHRDGDVGRSATIRYLHEYFRPKREQAELNRLRNNNAAHVQFVREQLEDQIEKQRDEARDACQDALDYLVEKMEPRAREDIEGMEDLIANILYRNVQMHCTAVAFDPSDAVALLWQKESYERVLVMQEWRAEFKDVFLPKKATFVQDVSVRPIQRAWRAYRLRKAWKERCAAEVRQLEEEEMQGRHEVEREELLEAGLEVVPCVAEGMELELWMTCYPPLLATLNESCLNTLAVEEWNARADILWEMRREEMSTSELMEVELMERAALVMEMHTNDAHAELFEDEAMERGMLCRERVLFLLRILVKEERVRRDGALRDSYELATREIMDHYEALRRNAIADAYCQFWQKEIYLPLHRLFITVDLDRLYTHDVQQLYTINQEGIERAHIKCSCKEQWLWICRGQETSDRNLVEIQEKLEREHINFFLEEAKARMKVEEDWFDPMRYMPSDFAAGLVNVVRQVYVRYLEETEDRVREHIESTEIPERRELAYRYVVENPIYIAKCIRQQKELAAEEQAARQTIRDACVQAVEYFPSSFAPEVVLHPEGIYVQCIAETEGHSRGYLVDAEHRERTDIEERFASTSPALWVFHREQRAEFVAREECEREELIDECHRGIRYFPSTFAPELINQGVSVYIKYLQDTEELVREYVDSREVAHRGQIEYDFAEELPTLENYLHKQRRDLGLNETAEREAIIDAWSPFMTIAAANAAAAAQAQREEEARETELAQNEAEARAREEMLADHQAKAASSSSEDAEPAPPTPPYTSELAFCMKNSNALADFFYATETRQRRALEEKQRLIHKGIVDLFKYKVPWLRLEQRDRMQEQSEKYFLGGWGGQLPHH